ncbi:MAG: hypothetical protein JO368_11240 [Acidimicrobiales bacterium]|nr:hypothetical protein [Acidimicrobiales bacterium]
MNEEIAGRDERVEHMTETLVRWLRIRERGRLPLAGSYQQLVDDIRHSALLRRLLKGREPLEVPPPRSYGQPWYRLVDEGWATGCELTPLRDRTGVTPHVAINESPWAVVAHLDDNSYLVRYSRRAPLYEAVRHADDPSLWDLWRLDVAAGGQPS